MRPPRHTLWTLPAAALLGCGADVVYDPTESHGHLVIERSDGVSHAFELDAAEITCKLIWPQSVPDEDDPPTVLSVHFRPSEGPDSSLHALLSPVGAARFDAANEAVQTELDTIIGCRGPCIHLQWRGPEEFAESSPANATCYATLDTRGDAFRGDIQCDDMFGWEGTSTNLRARFECDAEQPR